MIRTVFFIGMLGLFSTDGLARSIALAPAEYVDLATSETVAEAAKQVEEQVLLGAEEAGYEVVTGDVVASAIAEESGDGECENSCLQRVAVKLNVDDVVAVKVEDTDQVTYHVTISFAVREGVIDERTAGFYVVLEWLRGTVALALKQDAPPPMPKEPTVAEPEPLNDNAENGDVSVKVSRKDDLSKKKLNTTPFFVAAGVTAALGVTTLVLNGIAHKKFETANDSFSLPETADSSDIDNVENLQVAVKVSLFATALGLVTTGVIALFTDFSGLSKSTSETQKSKLTPGVVVGPTFGAVSIGGNF